MRLSANGKHGKYRAARRGRQSNPYFHIVHSPMTIIIGLLGALFENNYDPRMRALHV